MPNGVPKMMRYSVILAWMRYMLPIAPPALLKTHSCSYGETPDWIEASSGKGLAVMCFGPWVARREVTMWLIVPAVLLGYFVRASWKRVFMSSGLKI